MRLSHLACAAFLAAFATAKAGTLTPYAAERIELGSVSGVAYYFERPDGFHVVATLAEGQTGKPIRFEATLADRQKLVISVPGSLGEAARQVEFLRAGDQLTVDESPESRLPYRRGPHPPEG